MGNNEKISEEIKALNKLSEILYGVLGAVCAVFLACLIMWICSFSVSACGPEMDYMALMQQAAHNGDMEQGAWAEDLRNAKIVENCLPYAQTDIFDQSAEPWRAQIALAEYHGVELAQHYTALEAQMLAQTLYVECGGVQSVTEQACVAWTVCNRVSSGEYDSVYAALTARYQFAYYSYSPVLEDLLWLAEDVLERWNAELNGCEDVGRVLPAEYRWFGGDGRHNYFRNTYAVTGNYWWYGLATPYES